MINVFVMIPFFETNLVKAAFILWIRILVFS